MSEPFLISLILCASALIHGLVGFAFALTALPLLALVKSVKFSVPLLSFYSFTVNLVTFLLLQEKQVLKLPFRFFGAILLGVVAGVSGFKIASEFALRVILFLAIVAYFFFEVYRQHFCKQQAYVDYIDPTVFKSLRSLVVAFMVGFLGGILNTPGPPIVIYLSLLRFKKDLFKATLQIIFLMSALFAMLNHWARGNVSQEIVFTYLLYLPIVLVGLYVGQKFYFRLSNRVYYNLVNISLLISALLLLFRTH